MAALRSGIEINSLRRRPARNEAERLFILDDIENLHKIALEPGIAVNGSAKSLDAKNSHLLQFVFVLLWILD